MQFSTISRGAVCAAVLSLAAVDTVAAMRSHTDAIPSSRRTLPGAMLPASVLTGTITGRIVDEGGQPITRAIIRVVELKRSAIAGVDGKYAITQVPAGSYAISIAAIGFAPQVIKVTVRDASVAVNATLKHSLVELATVQVSATAQATSVENSPQPIAVLNQEDIMRVRSTSLGDALSSVAGMRNNSSGEAAGKPVIRGLTNNRVLVLDDGQRLEHNQWGDDHFSSVEPAASSRIEVIRGPASVLYGSDAIGGVVNVIEADLPDAIGRSPFVNGSVTAGFASGNTQSDGNLSLDGASGRFGFRASVTGRRAEDTKTPDINLWNSGYHNVGGTGSLGYRGTWGALTGRYTYRTDRLQLTDEDPTATGRAGTDDHRGRVELRAPIGSARLEWNAGFERNTRYEWGDATTTALAFGMRQQSFTTEARLNHAQLGRFSGLVGFAGEYTNDANLGEEFLEPDSKASDVALFAFEQTDAGHWNFSFGARYDYRHLNVTANQDIGNPDANLSWASLTGSFGALYHVSEPVALVLNIGRGFRSPSAFDLFANGLHEATSTFEHGNPTLKTETSLNTDVGVRVHSNAAAFEIGGFVNQIQNFIYTVPTNTTDPATGFEIFNVTQGNAVLSGFEGQLDYHPAEHLHLQGSADYVYGQNSSSKNPLPSMPPFRATYSARFEGTSLGTFTSPYMSLGGETNAKQTRFDPSELIFYAHGLDGAGYHSTTYTLVNAAAGFALPARGGHSVKFDFQLRNALDQAWVSYLSHLKTLVKNPGMGRSLVARVTAEF